MRSINGKTIYSYSFFINNVKIRIVHENMKSQSAQRLVHEIINLLTFPYVSVGQNLTSTKQLSRCSKLENCWHAYASFSTLTEKVIVSVSFQTSKWLKRYYIRKNHAI